MHPMLNIAITAARNAGDIIVRAATDLKRIKVEAKAGRHDYVTNVDHAAEDAIIQTIQKAYPEHSILAEESGMIAGEDEEYTWVIDPLDGTANFLHGIPHVAVSIAIQRKGIISYGVIYDPIRDELFTAAKGSGAQVNGKRMRVSTCPSFANSLIGTGFAYKRQADNPKFETAFVNILHEVADVRRAGSAALDLAYVAAGRLDGFWEAGLKPWDMAVGALMIREAGGLLSDFAGGEDFMNTGQIVAANPKIFQPLLVKLKRLG